MTDTLRLGRAGEDAVCKYIIDRGMKLLARNYRAAKGEIDLIACTGDTVVFIEVKSRSGLSYGTAAEAVGFHKQKTVIRTAQHFIAQHGLYESNIRFDVAEVYLVQECRINYIENAFGI